MSTTTPINIALYRLLVQMGASEADAEQAARIDTSDLATKADLANLKAELIKWNVGTLLALTTIMAALELIP